MTEQLSKTPTLDYKRLITRIPHLAWKTSDLVATRSLFIYKKIKTTFFQIANDGVANVQQFLSQKKCCVYTNNEISLSRTFGLNPSLAPLRTGHKIRRVRK